MDSNGIAVCCDTLNGLTEMVELHYGTQFDFGNSASQSDNPEEVEQDQDHNKNMDNKEEKEEGAGANSNSLTVPLCTIKVGLELHLTI